MPPPGFLEEVYKVVRKSGGVCIADEVLTYFGRTGVYICKSIVNYLRHGKLHIGTDWFRPNWFAFLGVSET